MRVAALGYDTAEKGVQSEVHFPLYKTVARGGPVGDSYRKMEDAW